MKLAPVVLLAVLLGAGCSSEGEPTPPEPSSPSPAIAARSYDDADQVLAALETVAGPKACGSVIALRTGTGANSELVCRPKGVDRVTFSIKVYDDEIGLRKGLRLFRQAAKTSERYGDPVLSIMTGAYWIVAGDFDRLTRIAPVMGGLVEDLR